MYDFEELNEIQKQAVLDTEGAVLVTAGAGSGKTRLLTHRIAHLIRDLGVKPYNILAITFTNKAANEMKERLEGMLDIDGLWVSTFHSACVKILRHFIDKIGFGKNFTIYGDTETKSIVKRIIKDKELNEDMVKRVLSEISKAKSRGIAPEDYSVVYRFTEDCEEIGAAYTEYQKVLKTNNALDYDDLLILTLRLLKTDTEAREFYQNKFKYIHIDEFQDTNTIQYDIVKILAQKHGNIFAVGDEDQCIYTWRGAAVSNMFDFQRDFKCRVYKLEQNYRSTPDILDIANKIIKGNSKRLDKALWTENDSGFQVTCQDMQTDGFEADFVARKIFELTSYCGYSYSDFAVLLRLNALTRSFEERFLQYGIPHRVYGGFKFFDRREIKDVLAYARVAINHSDDEAAYRVINFPRRQIGEASIEKLRAYTAERGISVYEAVTHADTLPFPTSLTTKLDGFGRTLAALSNAANGSPIDFFKYLLYVVLDIDNLFSKDEGGRTRVENLNELVNSVREFTRNNPDLSLFDYLQTVSLYSDTDDMTGDDLVTIATVHSAKGLEFPVVFVCALEDGIFPSLRMNENESEHMEEERRLMYVAVTRAKQRLYLTYAKSRFLYGEIAAKMPSRFLKECGLVQSKYDSRDVFTSSPSRRASVGHSSEDRTYGKPIYGGESFSGDYKSEYGKKHAESVDNSGNAKDMTVGAHVMHKRLGKGTVIGLEKIGDNVYAKIDFERGGVMILSADVAPLTVVED